MRNPIYSTRKAILPLTLLLLTLIYFWPQLVEGRVLYWGDIGLYFTPMQEFLRENLRAGRLPLWNPLILCGTPYVGNPQTWPLYPVTALLPFVSAATFLNLTIALHVWLAGMGTYLFARRAVSLGRGAALLSALIFMFGGQLVSKEQFPNMVQAAAWLPWLILGLDRLLDRRRLSDALWLGLVLGLQLLAAHPQMTLLSLYLAIGWGLWKQKPLREWPRIFGLLILAGAVAIGLSVGQIFPTLGLFHDAFRQKLSFFIVNRFFLPTDELSNFFLPKLHGHPFFGTWAERGNFWETCCYVGWLPCFLGLWAIVRGWRKDGSSPARFLSIVLVFGLWMSLGGQGGLYRLAYTALPGFRSFHDPARCLLWTCFSLALLAGYGWQKLPIPLPLLKASTLVLLLVTFADLTHFGRTIYPLVELTALPKAPMIAVISADPDIKSHQARILAPTPGVWLRFTSVKDYRQGLPDFQSRWADTLTPNLMMPYGLSDAYGYEPVTLKNAQKAGGSAAQAFYPLASSQQRNQAAEMAGVLAAKYIIICRVNPPEMTIPGLIPKRQEPTIAPPGKELSDTTYIYLSRNSHWRPRVRLVSDPTVPVTITADEPDRVELIPITSGDDTLILADTNAAGWTAAIDGKPAQIKTTEGSLRSVPLQGSGAHRVIFTYRPALFLLGLYLSLLTVLGLSAALSYTAARRIASTGGIWRHDVEQRRN